MKNLFKIILLMLLATLPVIAITPTSFTFQFYDANGQPNTNYTTMQGWPPSSGGVTVVSNVIVWAGASQMITNQFQGTNTLGTNSAMPNNYQVLCPATGLGFFVTIPQTTNLLPLASYATGLPVTYPSSSLYFYVTNALGFQPAAATFAGITNALGYFPATNNPATNTIIYLTGVTGTTNGSGVVTNIVTTTSTNTINYQKQ
jgi:hypothetical protein